jgi:hypothetical protein
VAESIQPWDQRADESPQAFRAFRTYLEFGPNRTVLEAYRAATGHPTATQASGTWNLWFAKHDWTGRSRRYDNRVAEPARAVMLQRAQHQALSLADRITKVQYELDERMLRIGDALLEKAERYIAFPAVQTSTSADGKAVTIEPIGVLELTRAAQAAQRAEELIRNAIASGKEMIRGQEQATPEQVDVMDSAGEAARKLSRFRAEQRRLIVSRPTAPPGKPAEEG